MAIPEKFKNLANAVRSEVYGRDVREAIAESIEESGTSSETAIKITEQLIDGSFDEAELTTEIERRLNELEEQYAPELNNVKSQLAQTETMVKLVSLNIKAFGAVGDGVTDDTVAIQKAFDFAKQNDVENVLIPNQTFAINSNGVTYSNPNSTINFKGVFKHVDPDNELHGDLFQINTDNVTIYDLKIDGDRDNNIYSSTNTHGTQFNFSSYKQKNIHFIGGWSRNALQNHTQLSSNVRFTDFDFDTSGEHSVYLTTTEDTVGAEYAIFENCGFKNWSQTVRGTALSGRDYFLIHSIDCEFIMDGEYVDALYVTSSQHRDTISNPANKKHVYTNCTFKGITTTGSIHVLDNINFTIENSKVEGGLRGVIGVTKLVKAINTTFILDSPSYTVVYPANVYNKCKFYGGRFRSLYEYDFIDCEVYKTEKMFKQFLDNYVSKNESNAITNTIRGNKFFDFNEGGLSSEGIIRCNDNIREIIADNQFINCGESFGISYIGTETVVYGNVDVSNTGVRIGGDLSNENVFNNVINDLRS